MAVTSYKAILFLTSKVNDIIVVLVLLFILLISFNVLVMCGSEVCFSVKSEVKSQGLYDL